MKMIFHLPFEPDKNRFSASQIRPYKMIKAFEKVGYNVTIVMGPAKTRKNQIKSIKKRVLDGEKFDFLYSESSTMPTLLTESHHLPSYPFLDFGFFYYIKQNNIPIGLFYRDIHWRFNHYNIRFYKRFVSTLFYKLDLFFYKKLVDTLFLPSIEMGKYIPELDSLRKLALPPGSERPKLKKGLIKKENSTLNILYVGGLGELYNLELFLDSLIKLNSENIQFTICTRKSDFEVVKGIYNKYLKYSNINLIHVGGEKLIEVYKDNDLCCLFVKPSQYWEFAMPVKLFEYIAHEKPIIAVKNTAVGNYVLEKGIGWAIDFEAHTLIEFLISLVDKDLDRERKILSEIANENTWENRAVFVADSLIGNK